MQKKYLFLFDLDGTLIDSTNVHWYSFKSALEEMGYPVNEKVKKTFMEKIGMKAEDIFKYLFPDASNEEIMKFRELKNKFFEKFIDKIKVIDVVYESLVNLKRKRYPTGLVTSSSRKTVDLISKRVPLYDLFDVIVTADDVVYGKPDPEPFLKAYYMVREKYGVSFDKVYYVGDTIYDKIGAEKAGFKFIYYKDFPKFLKNLGL